MPPLKALAIKRTLGGVFGELLRVRHCQLGSAGIVEEYSDANKIMLDFDRPKTPRLRQVFTLLRMCGLHCLSIRDDRTRKGWHRTILLRESLSREGIIAIQALLGSDRRRETLNLMRVLRTRDRDVSEFQDRRWNILYSRKLE